MTSITTAAAGHLWFKLALFALLTCNAVLFQMAGTLSEALDATAWLVLLALFDLETGYGNRFRAAGSAALIRITRFIAAVAIGAATVGYILDGAVLDAINNCLWIAVIVLLEFEVRYLSASARRVWFVALASALYTGLAALILIWAWRKEWFEAYDGLLWLLAFITIEVNVLRISARQSPPLTAKPNETT